LGRGRIRATGEMGYGQLRPAPHAWRTFSFGGGAPMQAMHQVRSKCGRIEKWKTRARQRGTSGTFLRRIVFGLSGEMGCVELCSSLGRSWCRGPVRVWRARRRLLLMRLHERPQNGKSENGDPL
jgi:hypothetical protein